MNEIKMENCGFLEYTLIEAEPIIGFNLCGERRICLPQLLRFVLPNFDINEIDRSVTDLQINCFQCNSNQMHLLHSENIVPKEVIRCGLIRKSDAERLCKYLLQRNQQEDKLYDSLIFNSQQSIMVVHSCFGEQLGSLFPAVYTSADAKCIKCFTCNIFYKTFEFVGHTHKLDEVTNTFHWGFDSNNWRLLLQLYFDEQNEDIIHLNESKVILDRVKSKFYEEELHKLNKSSMSIVWRPRRKLKLQNTSKHSIFSFRPSHLNFGPVEIYTKTINPSLTNMNVETLNNSNCVPNVYLRSKDTNVTQESIIDDDDADEFDDVVDKSVKHQDYAAMNIALQIKREAMKTDPITIGTISTFLNKNSNATVYNQPKQQPSINSSNSNYSPLVVAQPHTSVPPQCLVLESLWSQLFRDIIQLTHHVNFNTNNERNRNERMNVGELLRCQELFRSQWTKLAEENQSLKKTLAHELKQRQDLEIIRDQFAVSLKEITVEKENLYDRVKQLELKCEQLKGNMVTKPEIVNFNKSSERNTSSKVDEDFLSYRLKIKRHIDYNDSTSQEDPHEHSTKQFRKHSTSNELL